MIGTLKDTGSIPMTANLFRIATSTVFKGIYEVCHAISKILCPKYIKVPRTIEEMRNLIMNFKSKHGFSQAFGCINGTHSHQTTTGKHALNVQVVCNYQGLFPDIDCH